MRNRTWIIIITAAAAVLLIIVLAVRNRPSGHIANIYQNGVCIRSVDLSELKEPLRFTVTDQDGHENVVLAEPGRIRVESANCPDRICVNTGWLSRGVTPIVCMPARLVIRLEYESAVRDSGIDAVAG